MILFTYLHFHILLAHLTLQYMNLFERLVKCRADCVFFNERRLQTFLKFLLTFGDHLKFVAQRFDAINVVLYTYTHTM